MPSSSHKMAPSSSSFSLQGPSVKGRRIGDEDLLVPLLARRSCHLPGNDWAADWKQWFCNNHIFFGICLHHPWHPLEWWERSLALAASISFGLVATNIVFYLHVQNDELMEAEFLSYHDYTITNGMLLLWTLGGMCHSIFDMIIWHIMACACCQPGGRYANHSKSRKCRDVGSYMLIPVVLALLSLASYLVLLRASESSSQQDRGKYYYYEDNAADDAQEYDNGNNANAAIQDDMYVEVGNIRGAESFAFLNKYFVEVLLAWFVYFPIVGTILFSGCLGCNGKLPVLGGRPRDLRIVQEEQGRSKYVEF